MRCGWLFVEVGGVLQHAVAASLEMAEGRIVEA